MTWGELPKELTAEAFGLLLTEVPEGDREAAVASATQRFLASSNTESPDHILLGVWTDHRVRACWLLTRSGKSTFLVGDPGVDAAWMPNQALWVEHVRQLDRWTAGQRAKMVQVMLSDHSSELWEPLLVQQGWERATRLYYLEANPLDGTELAGQPDRFSWMKADRLPEKSLEHLLAQTHIESRDCPFLDGKRDPSEMLAGYRTATDSLSDLWEVLVVDGEPVACLLAGTHADQTQIEWVYVGVAALHRRKGYGRELVRRGFEQARSLNISSIVLGIDEGNLPAIHLYASAGFRSWARRVILIKWNARQND